MSVVKTTTGYYKMEISYNKKYFLFECGDIDGGFSKSKIIVLSYSECATLIDNLKAIMEAIKNENQGNTGLLQS